MKSFRLPEEITSRRAIVYVRQSTGSQVVENLESQRLQYEMANHARAAGFKDVVVIDSDLGISASGTMDRPGFRNLVGQVCEGNVGAVFCYDASRLARNGREWHHLLELCALVSTRVVDCDGAYDPANPNDRLLLGLKGTMSEFELTVMRRRLVVAKQAKAARGELRIAVPVGYLWPLDTGLTLDPDLRIQHAIRQVFQLFRQLGSAHRVLRHLRQEKLLFPRPISRESSELMWRSPCYRNVISVLKNPFFAGAYAHGKSRVKTKVVQGQVVKTYGNARQPNEWTLILDHHEAYISWPEYQKNQERLSRNCYGKAAGSPKSGRGGSALLSGLLRCGRCSRMLQVTYSGHHGTLKRYACRRGHAMQGLEPCISFGAVRPDLAVGKELLLAVGPLAVEAALMAEGDAKQKRDEKRRAVELEVQQARYEAQLAARRYHAVDPENRLVATELEAKWNASLNKLSQLENCEDDERGEAATPTRKDLLDIASNLEKTWASTAIQNSTKQQLVRALIEEIVVNVDDSHRQVELIIHWKGGQHSRLQVEKPRTGEHRKRTTDRARDVIREMAGRWSDEQIAATLNRMKLTTGQEHTWNAQRVSSARRKWKIPGYDSATKGGACLTMSEAATHLGVSAHVIRKMIGDKTLPARQVVIDAPWQILITDLEQPEVKAFLSNRRTRSGRPRRISRNNSNLMIPGI